MKKIVHVLILAALLLAAAAAVAENGALETAAGRGRVAGYLRTGAPDGEPQAPEIDSLIREGRETAAREGTCNVYVCDQDMRPVPGVVVRFCDAVCLQYTTDEGGMISFVSQPARYVVQIASVPEGYSFDADREGICDGSGDWIVMEIARD